MKYTIENDCLYVSIGGISNQQLLKKLLLQVYVWELHNIMVIPPGKAGIKEVRDAENNIIICDSTLCNIIIPQLK